MQAGHLDPARRDGGRRGPCRSGRGQDLAGGLAFRPARRIAELAASSRPPAFTGNRAQVGEAWLISYGADLSLLWRRAAVFVDKILKGARPGELAIEQPARFEFVVNLKAAMALGLTIPQSLLSRADEVIQ